MSRSASSRWRTRWDSLTQSASAARASTGSPGSCRAGSAQRREEDGAVVGEPADLQHAAVGEALLRDGVVAQVVLRHAHDVALQGPAGNRELLHLGFDPVLRDLEKTRVAVGVDEADEE